MTERTSLVTVNADNSTLEASTDGGATWSEVPYIGDVAASPGSTPENDIVTFKQVGKVRGKNRVPSLSVTIPSYVPNLPVWGDIADKADSSDLVKFRITTVQRQIHQTSDADAAAEADIANTGVLALGNDSDLDLESHEYNIGLVFLDDDNDAAYTIAELTDAGVATLSPAPNTAVADIANYQVVIPALRITFDAQPSNPDDNFNLPSEGVLNTTLDLTLRTKLPRWAIVPSYA